ncbi:MAG: hypothetical protein Q4A04_04455 [Eubacteriales bacterium]|nr:hypothetical protein [Eubacteriales bacterium]
MKKQLNPKVKKVLAVITLVLMALLVIGLIIAVIRKAAPGTILAFLFCLIVVPCVFYAILKFAEISRRE